MRRTLDEAAARQAIAATAREIYERHLSGATDGNLSVRLAGDRIATTPSGVHKGRLRPEDIVITDLAGRPLATRGSGGAQRKPSSEIALHLEAYRRRPDVHAVIHAHPPLAIAYQLAGGRLSEVLVSEVVFACGQIATAPYTTPTTPDVPAALGEYLACYDVILMERHGSVTLGADLDGALGRLDALEHTALIYCTVRMMGGAVPIPPREVDRLYAIAHPVAPPYRDTAKACPAPEPTGQGPGGVEEARVVAAVLERFGARSRG